MNTNAPATRAAGGALASLQNLKAGLQNVHQNIHVAGGEPIMRMGRDGKWIFGQENLEAEPEARWAANPFSIQHGYICWKVIPEGSKEKPELLGEAMVSMFDTKQDKGSLPDYGHPWDDCYSINLFCLDGEDKGEQVLYKTSSTGGVRAVKELIGAVMALPDDTETPVPVLLLKSDTYQHKTYGKTYFPVLDIVDWVAMGDQPDEADAPETEPEKAPAPAATTRRRGAAALPANDQKAAEPEPEQAVAPAGEGERRRRRRG